MSTGSCAICFSDTTALVVLRRHYPFLDCADDDRVPVGLLFPTWCCRGCFERTVRIALEIKEDYFGNRKFLDDPIAAELGAFREDGVQNSRLLAGLIQGTTARFPQTDWRAILELPVVETFDQFRDCLEHCEYARFNEMRQEPGCHCQEVP